MKENRTNNNDAAAIHFSGLNGLRAMAAIAVLFSHTTIELNAFGLDSHIFGSDTEGNPKASSLAAFGVSIFFALSGFLITYLLLEEKKKREIRVRDFYMRRILRIWPLYFFYFFLSILTLLMFRKPFDKSSLLYYAFLTPNIPYVFGESVLLLGHYWSLGVEEQFYTFWPWIVKKSKSILTTTFLILLVLIVAKCALRFIDISINKGSLSTAYRLLHTSRFQCMLIGATGGILYFNRNKLLLNVTNNLITQALVWLAIVLMAINKFHIVSFLDHELISIVAVILIVGQICKRKRIVNLDLPFFNFIGKISYGIYVFHPLVIFYLSKLLKFSDKTSIFSYLLAYVFVFGATVILSFLSYQFIEKRFLLLKTKYSTIKSSA